jgi:hypothetical protein
MRLLSLLAAFERSRHVLHQRLETLAVAAIVEAIAAGQNAAILASMS